MFTPLQIVLIRDRSDQGTDVYADTLRLAFEGNSGTPNAYLDDAVDLGIRVLEPVLEIGDQQIQQLLGGAQHTIVVVIGNIHSLTDLFETKLGSDNIVRVVPPLVGNSGKLQGERALDGVEPVLAPVFTALRTMHKARRVLVHGIGIDGAAEDKLKLFISHAKTDGVALAKSLIGILQQLQGLDEKRLGFSYFYDYEHLKPGEVWRQVLEAEAANSVLLALRSEAYESRYWCQREFLTAERNGMPIVVVDLRISQYHDCSLLPFDKVPTVRVHDGNLIRVVLHAMAAQLRALRAKSQYPKGIKVLPHRPSVYSLDGASKFKGREKIEVVAYPGPKLPEEHIRAVEPILVQGNGQIKLMSFDELEDF